MLCTREPSGLEDTMSPGTRPGGKLGPAPEGPRETQRHPPPGGPPCAPQRAALFQMRLSKNIPFLCILTPRPTALACFRRDVKPDAARRDPGALVTGRSRRYKTMAFLLISAAARPARAEGLVSQIVKIRGRKLLFLKRSKV